MAIPEEIVAGTWVGQSLRSRVFSWNGNSYWFYANSTGSDMFRSQTTGTADWTILDASNAPALSAFACDVFQTAHILHMISHAGGGDTTPTSSYHRFNMETELWEEADVEIVNVTNSSVFTTHCRIVAGGLGGVIHTVTPGPRSKIMGNDFARAVYTDGNASGTSWSVYQELNTVDEEFHIVPMGLVIGEAAKAYCFYARDVASSGDKRMWQRAASAGGILQTERIDPDGSNAYAYAATSSHIYIQMSHGVLLDRGGTSKCRVVYMSDGNSNTDLSIMEWDDAADPSTFTTQIVATSAITAGDLCFDLMSHDETLYCTYRITGTDEDLHIENDGGDDTWTGTVTDLRTTGLMSEPIQASFVIKDGDLLAAYTFTESGQDPWYDEHVISPTEPTALSGAEWPGIGGLLGPFEI